MNGRKPLNWVVKKCWTTSPIGDGSPFELELASLLSEYTGLRTEIGKGGRLALINLQKRLLSSVAAFSKTLKKHEMGKSGVTALKDAASQEKLEHDDLYGDEQDGESVELEAVVAATALLAPPSAEALKLLKEMTTLASRNCFFRSSCKM